MCFSPGIIHGAHQSLPTSPSLTRPYSVVYYSQILRPKERCVISRVVCFARRYLFAFHNVRFLMGILAPRALSVIMHYGILYIVTIAQHRTRVGFFQSASSSSPSDDPLSPSSSSLSCSLNWWIMCAPTIQVCCRFSTSVRSLTSSPLASGRACQLRMSSSSTISF